MAVIDKMGTISLYHKDELIDSYSYDSNYNRKRVMEIWKRRYGPKWKECFYQLTLHKELLDVNPDGTNMKKSGRIRNKTIYKSPTVIICTPSPNPKLGIVQSNYEGW